MDLKICKKCSIEKSVLDFHKLSSSKDGLRTQCKSCVNFNLKQNRSEFAYKRKLEYNKNYRLKNKEVISEYLKYYHQKNPNKRKKNSLEYFKNYHKHRNETDILFKLIKVVRSRVNKIIKINDISKKNKTFDIVGCTPEFLKEHLENQFVNDMSWENYGYHGWHIDHKIPLSSAKTEEEIYKLSHYTNLQPLWAEDNLKKSNK
jgi:hypothetical protein